MGEINFFMDDLKCPIHNECIYLGPYYVELCSKCYKEFCEEYKKTRGRLPSCFKDFIEVCEAMPKFY